MKNRKRYLRYKTRMKKMDHCGMWVNAKCPICDEVSLFYFDRYDANACISCDTWTDDSCNDPKCSYCSIRPSLPSEAFFLEELYFNEEKAKLRKYWLRRNYQHKKDGELRHKRKRELYTKLHSPIRGH